MIERTGLESDATTLWDPGRTVCVTDELFATISDANLRSKAYPEDQHCDASRTELDSHANMPVVGSNACILSNSGQRANVRPYSPDYAPMELDIVDAAIYYEGQQDGKEYILVIRNAISVPSMQHNLIPPFIMREKGIHVNDVPKIHLNDPVKTDHAITFPETGLCIPLYLSGTFSYFASRKPTTYELEGVDDVYVLTPDRFNPHDEAYAANERHHTDWNGDIVPHKDRQRIILSEIPTEGDMAISMSISAAECAAIDDTFKNGGLCATPCEGRQHLPKEADQASTLASISNILVEEELYRRLDQRAVLGDFMASIGSTDAPLGSDMLCDGSEHVSLPLEEEASYHELLDVLMDENTIGPAGLDDIMASSAHARKPTGVDAGHLARLWKITTEEAQNTINQTSQHVVRTPTDHLSRNYSTNDRMLRYRRIQSHFFMDTFFADKKTTKSSRGNTCCQLFVTDKGFVYVVPMKSRSELLLAVKQFVKEIGAPETIVSDGAAEQRSHALRKFLTDIGSTLRILEEGTPWANKAELYIGLLKEAVCKI